MPDATWPPAVAAMTLFTEDLPASEDFYRRFLDAEPIHKDADSCVFRAGPTLINLLRVEAVDELISPAPMAPPGVRAVYTFPVEDVDAACERLKGVGIALLGGPVDRRWGPRTANVQDPSGHVWELAS